MKYRYVISTTLVVAAPCLGQSTVSWLAVNGGSATDIAGNRSSALSASPTVTVAVPQASLTVGATATRFANSAWSGNVASAFTLRATGAFRPVIDVSALAATTSYRTSYATGSILPSLEADFGRVTAFAGARLDGATISRTAAATPLDPLRSTSGSSEAAGRALIAGGKFAAMTSGGEAVSFAYRAERGTIAGALQTDQVVSFSNANSRVGFGASLGRRDRAGATTTFGGGSLTVTVANGAAVQFAGGRYPANALLGVAAGTFVNAGIVFQLGSRERVAPTPSSVSAPPSGMTRLAIRAADAGRVDVAGDFSKWNPIAATRAENGVWYVDLRIPPGEYRYAFHIDGKEWRVPEGVAAVDDEFGGKSAWLTVKAKGSESRSR